MKRMLLTFLMGCLCFCTSFGQTLLDQIEHAYSGLDSAAYVEHVIVSYAKWLDKQDEEAYQMLWDIFSKHEGSERGDEDRMKIDSAYLETLKEGVVKNTENIDRFTYLLRHENPMFVLNLSLKDKNTLQVDAGTPTFHLFCFGKKYKGGLYVYCDKGEYSWQEGLVSTDWNDLKKVAPKVFRKIMRKHPKYLLFCEDLEGLNTLLYVVGKDVYIYRMIQMKAYKLDEYMKRRANGAFI